MSYFIYYKFILCFMKNLISEGSAKFIASTDEVPSKRMEVFYNPRMKHNRDIAIIVNSIISKSDMKIALPLCGSGIRGIRFLKELPNAMISKIYFNDSNPKAIEALKENLRINNIYEKVELSNKKADEFFASSKTSFDYIDIDPFGSPIFFIQDAIKHIKNDGIIAITSTDTSALCGTYPKACLRRYFAQPIHNFLMYEAGLRILIMASQREGARFGIALYPILAYSKDHYLRAFLLAKKSKSQADSLLNGHSFLHFNPKTFNIALTESNMKSNPDELIAGPLYTRKLLSISLQNRYSNFSNDKELMKFLGRLCDEKDAHPFYIDLHELAKRFSLELKPINSIIDAIKKKGLFASRTHFLDTAIKTDAKIEELISIIKQEN
ncbi:MAG: tRNA (guanine26-N2/guanine27-N2)-dimethyltransferase [Candidatus Woesearchaeota archaeon]|nr:tRNA (guanine26-N2/guanine27-N2)-dimethyltransferase [Candidatus Woesearchaeota archaeon]